MGAFIKFIKEWMLVIGMVTGASAYIIYHSIPALAPAGPVLLETCRKLQPALLFTMLFLTFSKVDPHDMKPQAWQWKALLIQALSFMLLAVFLLLFPDMACRIGVESLMLCMICPTATACAVVTDKLGGDITGVMSYTVMINLVTAVLVPLFVPLIHPAGGMTFFKSFCIILSKVFPLLIMPCLCAWLVRYQLPALHDRLVRYTWLSFYIWAFSLMLAILMSTRAIFHHDGSAWVLAEIAAASLVSCAVQFMSGKKVGAKYGHRITAGQSMGQKNTVFAIWMGYTFFDPVTSLAGGFYSIWHNIYNSWQLHQAGKK